MPVNKASNTPKERHRFKMGSACDANKWSRPRGKDIVSVVSFDGRSKGEVHFGLRWDECVA